MGLLLALQSGDVVNGTANGAIILATCSVIAGSATGGAASEAATLAATAAAIDGAGTGGSSADGSAVAVTSAVLSGEGTGAAAVASDLAAVSASIIAGNVGIEGGAAGALLLLSTALIDEGPETGGGAAGNEVAAATAVVLPGALEAGADVPGSLLPSLSAAVEGVASAGAVISGEVTAAPCSALEGTAQGAAASESQILSSGAAFLPATAWGNGYFGNAVLEVPASLIAGQASAGDGLDASAEGVTFDLSAALSDGEVICDQPPPLKQTGRSGRRRATPADFSRGFVQDAHAKGAVLAAVAAVVPGRASGEAKTKSLCIVRGVTAPGRVTVRANAKAASARLTAKVKIVSGGSHADAMPRSSVLPAPAKVLAGSAKGFDAVSYDNNLITILAA